MIDWKVCDFMKNNNVINMFVLLVYDRLTGAFIYRTPLFPEDLLNEYCNEIAERYPLFAVQRIECEPIDISLFDN